MDVSEARLSISIVTYNTDASVLESALVCIASSTIAANVYVVDNSPGRNLESVANAYGATYLDVQANLGYGRAHNVALRRVESNSRYHLILNPDVSFGPSVLEELYLFLEANPNVGWVMPKILYPNGSEQRLCKRLPTPGNLFFRRFARIGFPPVKRSLDRFECRDLDLTQPCSIPNLSGCFALVRTDLLRDLDGFDERFFLYLEDTDLVRRIGERAFTVFYPFTSVYHAHGRGSYRSLRLLGYHISSTIKYFCKWGWFVDHGRSVANQAMASRAPIAASNWMHDIAAEAECGNIEELSSHCGI